MTNPLPVSTLGTNKTSAIPATSFFIPFIAADFLEMLLSNAGHEHPLIFSNDHFTNYEDADPPLGIISNIKYKEQKIKFENSSMYIFTDGITEIKDSKGNMLESDGFKDYIKKYQSIPNYERLNKIVEDIIKSGRIQKDDLTIVVVDGN